jgi:hypothetical protein
VTAYICLQISMKQERDVVHSQLEASERQLEEAKARENMLKTSNKVINCGLSRSYYAVIHASPGRRCEKSYGKSSHQLHFWNVNVIQVLGTGARRLARTALLKARWNCKILDIHPEILLTKVLPPLLQDQVLPLPSYRRKTKRRSIWNIYGTSFFNS